MSGTPPPQRRRGLEVLRATGISVMIAGGSLSLLLVWFGAGEARARAPVVRLCQHLHGRRVDDVVIELAARAAGLRVRRTSAGNLRVHQRFVGFSTSCTLTRAPDGTVYGRYSEFR